MLIYTNPHLDAQTQSYALEYLESVLGLPSKENSVVVHVESISMACRCCPCLKTRLNCNQCNRWNQREA